MDVPSSLLLITIYASNSRIHKPMTFSDAYNISSIALFIFIILEILYFA
tara:strand:- start:13612 stop:13758 length:147 start_codon:yes stop_codon:yes gene_type:complete